MSGGDISLTHRGLIGAKTAELPQTLSRVSKLSFCQIERKMLSDRNYLELRKCDQSLPKKTIAKPEFDDCFLDDQQIFIRI